VGRLRCRLCRTGSGGLDGQAQSDADNDPEQCAHHDKDQAVTAQ
jgi:hypothetical protein